MLTVLRLGARMPGRLVAVFAPLALVALPRFYGHAFNNSKDIPFACAFVWAVHASCRLACREAGSRLGPALLCGLAVGAALAIRPGGLPLLLGLFGLLLAWRLGVRDGGARGAWRGVLQDALVAWAAAWLVMVALWPWAHESPVLNPLRAVALLAGLAAASLVEVLATLAQRHAGPRPAARVRVATVCAMGLTLATAFVQHVRLHPYQSTYFNALVDGVAGADGRYETDHWLSSYKEAIEWVNARTAGAGREVTVLVAADPYSSDCAASFLGPGVCMVRTVEQGVGGALPEPFDFYVATTRYGLDANFPGSEVAHRVGRLGATFTVIRAREGGAERSLAGR